MRARKFAETSANLFLFGLPVVVIGIPAIAIAVGSLPLAAQPVLRTLVGVLAVASYVGLPCIGLAGAGVGLWCHFRKDCGYGLWKPVLVLLVLAIYGAVAIIAVRTYPYTQREGRASVSLANPAHAKTDSAAPGLPQPAGRMPRRLSGRRIAGFTAQSSRVCPAHGNTAS